MLGVKVAIWFKSKNTKKVWFLILFSVLIGLVMTLLTRTSSYLIDVYFYSGRSEAFRPVSIVISLILFTAFGIYTANNCWKATEKV